VIPVMQRLEKGRVQSRADGYPEVFNMDPTRLQIHCLPMSDCGSEVA